MASYPYPECITTFNPLIPFDTGRDQFGTVFCIGADRGTYDLGPAGQGLHVLSVRAVGHQAFDRPGQAGSNGVELGLVAPGDGPAQAAGGSVLSSHVLRDQLAGKTCRTKDDDIEISIAFGHVLPLLASPN